MLDREAVRARMARTLGKPADVLADDAVLLAQVHDSFALVEMVIDLQDEFGVRLVGDDLMEVKTVGQLLDVVESKATRPS